MGKGVAVAAAAALALGCLARSGPSPAKPDRRVSEPRRGSRRWRASRPCCPRFRPGEVPAGGMDRRAAGTPRRRPTAGPWAPPGPWEEDVRARLRRDRGRMAALTQRDGLRRPAQLGRFFLEKQAPAPEPLQRLRDRGVRRVRAVGQRIRAAPGRGCPIGRARRRRVLPLWGRPDRHRVMAGRTCRPTRGRSASGSVAPGRRARSRWWSYESTPVALTPLSPVPDVNGDVVDGGPPGRAAPPTTSRAT